MAENCILVLDFGGQYTHLIARRVRDLGVYSEILPFDASLEKLKKVDPKGIILSGGPSSVYEDDAPCLSQVIIKFIKSKSIPVLGLCYGHQLIADIYGGKVEPQEKKEYGKAMFKPARHETIFEDVGQEEVVWMSHGDQVVDLPPDFVLLGSTDTCPIAAMGNLQKHIYGLQFHVEVKHTVNGRKILKNFVSKICKAEANWDMGDWIEKTVTTIRERVKDRHVILGISGGVDSTVVAVLLKKALGDQVHLIFVNNGVLRKNEAEKVCDRFENKFKFENFHFVDAEDEFLEKLSGVDDPEEKRKIIGHTFIEVFERNAIKLGKEYGKKIHFLAQGTIYPDRVESQQGTGKSTSAKIKSHHNLMLPDDMVLEVIEPVKDLYKDEVREIGLKLGVPKDVINRHPFPGPGLAVRCLGAIEKEKLDILRDADAILIEEIEKAGIYNSVWQAFATFIPVKTVGVMGDFRTYNYLCGIRCVNSVDAMTANFSKLDWDLLERISTRIINEVDGFNRVVYDISNKPPSTIEFE